MSLLVFLFSFALAHAEEPRQPYFALDCPGKPLILSFRREWEKSGFEFAIPQSGSDAGDYRWATRGWSESKKLDYDSLLERNIRVDSSGVLDWRKGIQLIPSSLGLPDTIDGCRVVPIAAYLRHNGKFREYSFLASADDFSRLPAGDQALLVLLAEKIPEGVLRATFAKSSLSLTLKEKAKILSDHEIDSFVFSRPKAWGGYNLKSCDEWWDDNTPKKCLVSFDFTGPSSRSLLAYGSTVSFWPNGFIRTGVVYGWGDLIQSLLCNDSHKCKFNLCAGEFSYLENGSFEKATTCEFP